MMKKQLGKVFVTSLAFMLICAPLSQTSMAAENSRVYDMEGQVSRLDTGARELVIEDLLHKLSIYVRTYTASGGYLSLSSISIGSKVGLKFDKRSKSYYPVVKEIWLLENAKKK